jgi:hypothetical protein
MGFPKFAPPKEIFFWNLVGDVLDRDRNAGILAYLFTGLESCGGVLRVGLFSGVYDDADGMGGRGVVERSISWGRFGGCGEGLWVEGTYVEYMTREDLRS